MFLDYDGTLTPIVARSELAVLDPEVRATLRRLADVAEVAIVSGRDLDDVDARVGVEGVTVAGSHGFEARSPDGRRETFVAADSLLPALDGATGDLKRRVAGVPGVLVERKRFAIAAHFRAVAPDRHAEVVAAASEVAASYPTLRLGHGKMVVELRPAVDWHKGRFVTTFVDRRGGDGRGPAVYLGDDATDEDAFEALRSLDPPGIGVLVGAPEGRPTAARYVLTDVAAVHEWLTLLTRELGG